MSWIIENLQTLATLGSALVVYSTLRSGSKKDYAKMEKQLDKMEKRLDKMEQRFDKVEQRFDKVDEKLQILDSRISRIEGQLAPRIWEPQILEKKKEE